MIPAMKPGSFFMALPALGWFLFLISPVMQASEPAGEAGQHFLQAAASVLEAAPEHIRIEPGPATLATGHWKAFRATSHAGKKSSFIVQGFAPADAAEPVVLAQSVEGVRHFLKTLDIARPAKSLPVEDLVARLVWLYPALGDAYRDPAIPWKNENHRHRGRTRITFTTKRPDGKGGFTFWKVHAQVENDWTLRLIPSQLKP